MILKQRYNPRRAERRVRRHARRHAKQHQQPLLEPVLVTQLGPEPVIDLVNDPRQQRLEEERHGDPRLPAWRDELEQIDQERAQYPSVWPLRFAFVFLLLVEFAGIQQLLKAQGMENPERSIVAAAGSCILFFFAYRASKEVA